MLVGMWAWLTVLIAVLGLLVYAWQPTNTKLSWLGLAWHVAGMVGVCVALGGRLLRIL